MTAFYPETFSLGVYNQTTGAPLTGADVELHDGLGYNVTGNEIGTSGRYRWYNLPQGKYELFVNGTTTGESYAVGSGRLERIGYVDGQILTSYEDDIAWQDPMNLTVIPPHANSHGVGGSDTLTGTFAVIGHSHPEVAVTDATLTGNGSIASPLSVVQDYVTVEGNSSKAGNLSLINAASINFMTPSQIGISDSDSYGGHAQILIQSKAVGGIINGGSGVFSTSADDSYLQVSHDLNSVIIGADNVNDKASITISHNNNLLMLSQKDSGEILELQRGGDYAAILFPFENGTAKTIATEEYVTQAISGGGGGTSSQSDSTGIVSCLGALLGVASATAVSLGAFTGKIVDSAGTVTSVAWVGSASVADTFVGTTFNTYFMIDSTGAVVQLGTHPTPAQRRANIYIGFSVHAPLGTITTVTNEPDIAINEMSQVRDILTGAFGLVNKGVLVQPNGENLQLNRVAGTLYGLGLGFVVSVNTPSQVSISSGSAITFQYRTQTGAATANITSVECGFYDVAGVRTALSNNRWTNQRVYLFPSGLIRLQYGQVQYNSLALAVSGYQTETFVPYAPFASNGILIGIIAMKSNGTVLNGSDTQFITVSSFGEALNGGQGLSTIDCQGVYNNSANPEVLTDTTRGAMSFRRGSATDTDAVIEVQNGAGTVTASVDGNGNMRASSNISLNAVGTVFELVSPNATDLHIRRGGNQGFTPFISSITPLNAPAGANWWAGAEYGFSSGLGIAYSWKMFAGSTLDSNFYVQKHINNVFGAQYELALRNANNTFTGTITAPAFKSAPLRINVTTTLSGSVANITFYGTVANQTINVPLATGSGLEFVIRNISTQPVTVAFTGSTYYGDSTFVLYPSETLSIFDDASTTWI